MPSCRGARGPDDTNMMRTLRPGANGCHVTERNPQEGLSFRMGLGSPPLILLVPFTHVHGNKGITINTAFESPNEEWQLGGRPRAAAGVACASPKGVLGSPAFSLGPSRPGRAGKGPRRPEARCC